MLSLAELTAISMLSRAQLIQAILPVSIQSNQWLIVAEQELTAADVGQIGDFRYFFAALLKRRFSFRRDEAPPAHDMRGGVDNVLAWGAVR